MELYPKENENNFTRNTVLFRRNNQNKFGLQIGNTGGGILTDLFTLFRSIAHALHL